MSKKIASDFVPLDTIVRLREQFRKENPATYKEMCCVVDNFDGDPSCVWDNNEPDDCRIACKGTKKEDCKYWVERERYNSYTPDDVWDWLKKNQSNTIYTEGGRRINKGLAKN